MNTKQTIREHLLTTAASKQWQSLHVEDHHGIVVPLFSLHSASSGGIGEYPDLLPLINWCRTIGFDIIQLLPLNDTGHESSPYSAISAFALNPIHLGLAHLPSVKDNQELTMQLHLLQTFNKAERVDYRTLEPKREAFLRDYCRLYGDTIKQSKAYQNFKDTQHFWLDDYAVFKAIKILQGWKNWEEWPDTFKYPSQNFLQNLPKEIEAEAEFHRFLQFLCFQQMEEVARHAENQGIYLKGDIPILINRDSADVWRHPEFFILEFAAGAPPDMYSDEGQKWGFPLYNWEAMAKGDYNWWIKRLEVASHLYHLYRIDHVVGFFRIWAIPLTSCAKDGHFTPLEKERWIQQGESIMRIMLDNCSMLPIGEDLGDVPPEVRICLRKLGICGTKVMRWERNWNGDKQFTDPKTYIPESMTTVSTHDSETLVLWWQSQPEEAREYCRFVGGEYQPDLSLEQHLAILKESHHSGSLFHINLLQEYLALVPGMTHLNPEDERINIPGICSDANWSYRFIPSVETIQTNQDLYKIMCAARSAM